MTKAKTKTSTTDVWQAYDAMHIHPLGLDAAEHYLATIEALYRGGLDRDPTRREVMWGLELQLRARSLVAGRRLEEPWETN